MIRSPDLDSFVVLCVQKGYYHHLPVLLLLRFRSISLPEHGIKLIVRYWESSFLKFLSLQSEI